MTEVSKFERLLSEALAAQRPVESEAAQELIASGAAGLSVMLAAIESVPGGRQQFGLAEMLSRCDRVHFPELEGRLTSRVPSALTILGVAFGWAGLHTAPIIARASDYSAQSRLYAAWGLGGVMCAATRYREVDALLVLQAQVEANLAQGVLFSSTAELEMNVTWSRAALWVFRNRARFAVGTRTPRGIICETGLPYEVQVRPLDDWSRASLVQTWLIDPQEMDQGELGVLATEWGAHPNPGHIALHWGRGALWALRELSREEVQSVC